MSTTKTNPKGQERKAPASRLDRLGQILDTIAEGLNQGVQQAVERASARAPTGACPAPWPRPLLTPRCWPCSGPPTPRRPPLGHRGGAGGGAM
jgi:hypothetical protein